METGGGTARDGAARSRQTARCAGTVPAGWPGQESRWFETTAMMNQAAGPGDTDWKLSRTGGREGLNPGESMLLDALFWNSNEVTISQLRGTLRSTLAAASNWLR